MTSATQEHPRPVEDRLQAVEDRLEIYNLIASHSPIADSHSLELMSAMYTDDGVVVGMRGPVSMRDRRSGNDDPARAIAMREAAKMGIAHLGGPPYIKLGKDTAIALSYVTVTVRDPTADVITVPAHGDGRGHRTFLIAANRWNIVRTDGSWKLSRREGAFCDGSDSVRELGRSILDAVLVD